MPWLMSYRSSKLVMVSDWMILCFCNVSKELYTVVRDNEGCVFFRVV